MTTTTMLSGLLSTLTSVPEDVPDDLVRYYVYWKIFYLLAAIGHFLTLLTFWHNGVGFMAAFNIFSVFIFALALFLLKHGFYRLAYWGALTELTLHGIAAVICVGNDYAFENYPFLVAIMLFIQPFYRLRTSMLIAAIVLVSAAAVKYYSMNNPPLYLMPEESAAILGSMGLITWPIYVLIMVLPFIQASARAEKEIADAYGESERLLLNILPAPIAKRLKATQGMIADDYENVAILFADIAGFTQMSGRLRPAEIVSLLNDVFNAIDELVEKHGAEKIKTIGDAYMVVVGLPRPDKNAKETAAKLALEISAVVSKFRDPGSGESLQVRIGINSGSVVAGVIGNKKFAYDLWGDAVNLASRMESTGEVGRIQVPESFATALMDRFKFEPRGNVEIKGKGKIDTSFLIAEAG